MKKLYLLTPSDRFNYGDMLFSHIVKHYFENKVDQIVYCSTIDSDLSVLGGIPTQNFRVLYKLNKWDKNILFVGGGDSLCIGWPMVVSFLSPTINWFTAIDHKLRTNFFEKFFIRYRYGAKTMYPFSIGKYELNNIDKVFYNSLGGSFLHENIISQGKSLHRLLSSVDYISVRDSAVYEELKDFKIIGNLVPDSAILMSEVFSADFLHDHLTQGLFPFQAHHFVFFQINKTLYSQNSEYYVNAIKRVLSQTDLEICLCPIGTALGHGDDEALELLFSCLNDARVHLVRRPSIWDIMWLISNALLYIGSSLHGAITAMSFGIPFVVTGTHKLSEYLRTWCPESFNECFAKQTDLADKVSKKLVSCDSLNVSTQKQLVMQSFAKMMKLME
mgnify:CR=1 FL=1